LAKYTIEWERNNAKAKDFAKTAMKLAACDGSPYYYKVAYDEATRFLESLG